MTIANPSHTPKRVDYVIVTPYSDYGSTVVRLPLNPDYANHTRRVYIGSDRVRVVVLHAHVHYKP